MGIYMYWSINNINLLKLKTMQSILTIALGTIFPKENIKSIMEVIGATPNPEVATQILLGIYVEPVVQESAIKGDNACVFKSYDKWSNTVNYTYLVNDSKHIYVKEDVDVSLITEHNYLDYKVNYSNNDVKGFHVKLSTMVEINHSCDLDSWNGKPLVFRHDDY